jgi:hypothetical protein
MKIRAFILWTLIAVAAGAALDRFYLPPTIIEKIVMADYVHKTCAASELALQVDNVPALKQVKADNIPMPPSPYVLADYKAAPVPKHKPRIEQ